VNRVVLLPLLHLCDSLFPIGAFAYSDGLETATTDRRITTAADLRAWLDLCLDETIGRMEGPAVWHAWLAARDTDGERLAALDEELTALRPSSAARRSSRAMGARLLTTWSALHPDPRLAELRRRASPERSHGPSRTEGPALPIAFAAACVCAGADRRTSVEAFAYTRLAATVSASMRLMPIGQTEAHALLARTLERVRAVAETVAARDARIESFSPALDIAAMRQQYLHSRLFRS
jgi:urease accessory protein